MIIRSILTGSAWREYKNGCRELCGVKLPDGMKENERFPEPIITPTTKADEGHDMNISREEIIAQGIVSEEDYKVMEEYTRKLFARGQMIAEKQGLILVDTKYEFGKRDGKVYLIDEIHTPDSSRYFYADGYEEKLAKGEPQKQLSKEFVRQWLIEHNFMNEPGQVMPEITDEYAMSVSDRYIELYEHIIGERFEKAADSDDIAKRIEENVTKAYEETYQGVPVTVYKGERGQTYKCYDLSTETRSFLVIERYSGDARPDSIPSEVRFFGKMNGAYYHGWIFKAYSTGLDRRPSIEWLQSFGLKPYEETETE
jgi:phosphoribosylaminoimidazole-succinocarboxamide synthase